jgi:hypothetical protein
MIKFFRNIRQNLLKQGQTSKYLKYAIGEIVLVVIGILIALQINNWNENRKSIIEGNKLIGSIYNDLKNDRLKLDSIINNLSTQRAGGLEVLKTLEKNDRHSITDQRFFNLIGWNLTGQIFVERNEDTWDGLKATGQQKIIRNDSLAVLLNNYYTSFDRFISKFNELPKKARMDLRELVSQCHDSEDLSNNVGKGIRDYVHSKYVMECILDIKELPKFVSSIVTTAYVIGRDFETVRKQNEHVITYFEYNLGDIIQPKH